jgi:DNA-3-methyladenine glycosylase II
MYSAILACPWVSFVFLSASPASGRICHRNSLLNDSFVADGGMSTTLSHGSSKPGTGSPMKMRPKQAGLPSLTFELIPVPPFSLEYTAWALRRRSENRVDLWDGTKYQRVLMLEGRPAEVQVSQQRGPERPSLEIAVLSKRLGANVKSEVTRILRGMLGLDADLTPFYRLAAKDSKLRPLAERYRGLKPVCFPTVFEALANAIACQQFTLVAGLRLLGELAQRGSVRLRTESGVHYGFPEPADLLRLPAPTFRRIGFSRQKTAAFRELSRGILNGRLDLEALHSLDNNAVTNFLMQLRGVGRWSAEYVLLRGLGRLDVFPADDVGARKGLAKWMRLRSPMNYESVVRALQRWHPFGGLAYFHMLMESLRAAGKLQAG